jgi:prepilin-type processing-associated H-X9-DG protein/prepilin-type N-terminal cleavage/methylation domain-containing protein
MPSRRRAFTLVELLVVVGIITVLIAMLLPALSRARQNAVRIKCQANLRSIGQALTMYVQQYGVYPCYAHVRAGAIIWPVRLRPFVGDNRDVFYCPAQDERCKWKTDYPASVPRAGELAARYGYEIGEPLLLYPSSYFSYGYNSIGVSNTIWGSIGHIYDGTHRGLGAEADTDVAAIPGAGHLRANRVKLPSDMIAIGDTTADGLSDCMINPRSGAEHVLWPATVHSGGANILFCDGHVRWFLRKDLLVGDDWTAPRAREIRRMWNNNHEPD